MVPPNKKEESLREDNYGQRQTPSGRLDKTHACIPRQCVPFLTRRLFLTRHGNVEPFEKSIPARVEHHRRNRARHQEDQRYGNYSRDQLGVRSAASPSSTLRFHAPKFGRAIVFWPAKFRAPTDDDHPFLRAMAKACGLKQAVRVCASARAWARPCTSPSCDANRRADRLTTVPS